jgi:hypothetical protein
MASPKQLRQNRAYVKLFVYMNFAFYIWLSEIKPKKIKGTEGALSSTKLDGLAHFWCANKQVMGKLINRHAIN